MEHNSDEDDVPQLSMETFAALQEFYREQENKELAQKTEVSSVPNIQEDWQLSQFWYNEETIEVLTNLILNTVGKKGKVALISCPSLYPMVKTKINDGEVELYEFDKRFSMYGEDFKFYDYNEPLEVSEDKKSYFDLVVADPPFLSEECLSKTSQTIEYLAKENIILCTGAIMASLAKDILNVSKIDFEPKHKNNLGNEFWCYTNFDIRNNT